MLSALSNGVIHPLETASTRITRRVGERPLAECDIFFRDLNTFTRPQRNHDLEIYESDQQLTIDPNNAKQIDPSIPVVHLFGGTILDTKIVLTSNDRIGRCVTTGTGYASRLDITIKERYATVSGDTCAEVIIALLNRYATGLGLTWSTSSIVSTDICPDLIFGYQFLSEALTLVADAGNVVWCVDETGQVCARSRDHLTRFDRTMRGAGFSISEGAAGTCERIEYREDPTNFANEVTVLGAAPQTSTVREVFDGDGATTSWALNYSADAIVDIDVVDDVGTVQDVASFGGMGDDWQIDTTQSRVMQAAGNTPLANGWQVRVTYNFHLPIIYTAEDTASIGTYGRVAAPVEENPELNTIESVSQRATSKLRRHTEPTQILDIMLRPGVSGPFESHGVQINLPRHGIPLNEVWLVEEVEIEELPSQLLQLRVILLQRDHESLYAQTVKQRRSQPSEPTNIDDLPGLVSVELGPTRIGSETDLFSADLAGSHSERITGTGWTDIPGGAVAQLHGAAFGTSAIQWIVTARLIQPQNGTSVTGQVRLFNRTTNMARGAAVPVTSPHADFHGSHRLALDDSVNRYVLQGRIVERDIASDPKFNAGLYVWAGQFVKPR